MLFSKNMIGLIPVTGYKLLDTQKNLIPFHESGVKD